MFTITQKLKTFGKKRRDRIIEVKTGKEKLKSTMAICNKNLYSKLQSRMRKTGIGILVSSLNFHWESRISILIRNIIQKNSQLNEQPSKA